EPRRRRALFRRAEVATSSPWVALSRSGPRKRRLRWKAPSLFYTTPGATRPAQGSQSASWAGRRWYSVRFSMVVSSHIEQRRLLDVPGKHLQELRVQTGTPHRQRVTYQPERQARQPQL